MTIVWLDVVARAQIEHESRRHRLCETGGPLFGFHEDRTAQVVIVGAGGPGPRARHRRRTFTPDRDAVDRAIARVHDASTGRYSFLGSWHTHPLGRPIPSDTDTDTAAAIATDEASTLPTPLILIHATTFLRKTLRDRDLCAYCWQPTDSTLASARLAIVRERTYPTISIDWKTVVA